VVVARIPVTRLPGRHGALRRSPPTRCWQHAVTVRRQRDDRGAGTCGPSAYSATVCVQGLDAATSLRAARDEPAARALTPRHRSRCGRDRSCGFAG
jgi:hypothetical protein